MDNIISFGLVDAGMAMYKKLGIDGRKLKAEEFASSPTKPSDFRKTDWNHVAAMIGAQEIGITIHEVANSIRVWNQYDDIRHLLQSKHGRDVEVRVLSGLVFEVRDKKGMSYREFAIFCAILSKIGDKKHGVRIIREQIQQRMLGYKSKPVMQSELGSRTDGATPMTVRQIGYTVDKLHERRFFARARANERQTSTTRSAMTKPSWKLR
jgi:hypothetical protein